MQTYFLVDSEALFKASESFGLLSRDNIILGIDPLIYVLSTPITYPGSSIMFSH